MVFVLLELHGVLQGMETREGPNEKWMSFLEA